MCSKNANKNANSTDNIMNPSIDSGSVMISKDNPIEEDSLQVDSYENYASKLTSVLSAFPANSKEQWNFFMSNYYKFPPSYRMRLMTEVVYSHYPVDYVDFLGHINQYYHFEETSTLKQERITRNRELLKNYVKDDGTLYLYRTMSIGSLSLNCAVNFFVEEEDGLNFKNFCYQAGNNYVDVFPYIGNIECVLNVIT